MVSRAVLCKVGILLGILLVLFISLLKNDMGRCRQSRWCSCILDAARRQVMYCRGLPPRLSGWGRYAHVVFVDGKRWFRPWEITTSTSTRTITTTTSQDRTITTTTSQDIRFDIVSPPPISSTTSDLHIKSAQTFPGDVPSFQLSTAFPPPAKDPELSDISHQSTDIPDPIPHASTEKPSLNPAFSNQTLFAVDPGSTVGLEGGMRDQPLCQESTAAETENVTTESPMSTKTTSSMNPLSLSPDGSKSNTVTSAPVGTYVAKSPEPTVVSETHSISHDKTRPVLVSITEEITDSESTVKSPRITNSNGFTRSASDSLTHSLPQKSSTSHATQSYQSALYENPVSDAVYVNPVSDVFPDDVTVDLASENDDLSDWEIDVVSTTPSEFVQHMRADNPHLSSALVMPIPTSTQVPPVTVVSIDGTSGPDTQKTILAVFLGLSVFTILLGICVLAFFILRRKYFLYRRRRFLERMNRLEFDLDSLRESTTSIDMEEDELFRERLKIAEAQSLLDKYMKAKQKSSSSSEDEIAAPTRIFNPDVHGGARKKDGRPLSRDDLVRLPGSHPVLRMPGRDPTPDSRPGVCRDAYMRQPTTLSSFRPTTLHPPGRTSPPPSLPPPPPPPQPSASHAPHDLQFGESNPGCGSFHVRHVKGIEQSSSASDSPQTPQHAVRVIQVDATCGDQAEMIQMIQPSCSLNVGHVKAIGSSASDSPQTPQEAVRVLGTNDTGQVHDTEQVHRSMIPMIHFNPTGVEMSDVNLNTELDGGNGDDGDVGPEGAVGGISPSHDHASQKSKKSTSSATSPSSSRMSQKEALNKAQTSNTSQPKQRSTQKPVLSKETLSSSYKLRKKEKKTDKK